MVEPANACAAGGQVPDADAACILLIEDDAAIADSIVQALTLAGMTIDWCADAEAAELMMLRREYRVSLVDRNLPGLDGLSFTRRIREKYPGCAVVIISALGGLDDRIDGLGKGADDYIAKPFALAELVARVKVQLRRPAPPQTTVLRYGSLQVDLIERTVLSHGKPVDLLPREFILLVYFMRRPEQLITRDMLLTDVWHYNFLPQTNLVDVHLGRLRRKIDEDASHSLIQNVRGAGFILRAE